MNEQDELISEKVFNISAALFIGAGLILRVRAFLTGRSLWLDEAMLALNIVNRSFAGLFQQPMEYGQSSPIGYVISVKAVTQVLGDSEYALRFFSLMAGSLALIFMVPIGRKVLGRMGGLMALVLFAFNPYLIHYSSELKQYIADVFSVTCLFLLFLWALEPGRTVKKYLALGVAGTILLWFSHPLVLVLAGIGITLFFSAVGTAERRSQQLLPLLICGLCWGISAVILYIIHFRHLASSSLLLDYWQEGFMPMPPWSDIGWFARTWQAVITDPLGMQVPSPLLFVISLLGFMYLFQKEWRAGSVIAITFGLALVTSGLGAYPLAGRLLLFSTPFLALVFSAGILKPASWIKRQNLSLWFQIILLLYILWVPLRSSVEDFIQPTYYEHMKPYMEYLRESRKENDLVYVYYAAEPAFRFYVPKFRLEDLEYVTGSDHSSDPDAYFNDMEQLRGRKRVWLLFSHIHEEDGRNDKETILSYADRIGRKIREFKVPGSSVYLFLYDFE